jgi:hypothetical protein
MPTSNNSGLQNMFNAIATAEGYGPAGNVATRGNNPGDLHNGDVGNGFATTSEPVTQYSTIQDGTNALNHQISIIANGTSSTYNAIAKADGLSDASQLTIAQVGAAYSATPGWANNVAAALGVSPDTKFSDVVNGTVSTNAVSPPGGGYASSSGGPVTTPVSTAGGGNYTIPPTSPYVPPTGASYDAATIAAANVIPLQVNDGSLANVPWYKDNNLITGNPRIRQSVQPVSFVVYLSRSTGEMLTMSGRPGGTPIQLQLNTSMKTFEIMSKHVYNKTPSRTGFHITFWGMQPDLINGTGSTGVFMNQFGITDFFSVANVTSDVTQLVTQGFKRMFNPSGSGGAQTSTGAVAVTAPNLSSSVGNVTGGSANEAFRVAAQDAFVELLKLFQMNGNVWYQTKGYTGNFSNTEQTSPNGWTSKSGSSLSVTQQHGRNNDVMTRGYVAMKHRNNVYLGYFKSLNWSLDAENPFQWKFNFVFQVEQTYAAMYVPTGSNQSNINAGQAAIAGITGQTGV